jgi:hypothetical protein
VGSGGDDDFTEREKWIGDGIHDALLLLFSTPLIGALRHNNRSRLRREANAARSSEKPKDSACGKRLWQLDRPVGGFIRAGSQGHVPGMEMVREDQRDGNWNGNQDFACELMAGR